MARPSKYQEVYAAQAAKLCRLGATDEDLADFFDVVVATIATWKHDKPGFLDAIKGAKDEADAQVVKSLYRRALGYSHPSVKIFCDKTGGITEAPYTEHYPPDTTACIFWLKNRQPKDWRDRQDLQHSGPNGEPLPDVISVKLIRAST